MDTNAYKAPRGYRFSLRTLMIVITLICLYLGLYSATLQPVWVGGYSAHGNGTMITCHREPRFRVGDTAAQFIFGPLVWLDGKIRPSYWGNFSVYDPRIPFSPAKPAK